jgi:hypothetical protein
VCRGYVCACVCVYAWGPRRSWRKVRLHACLSMSLPTNLLTSLPASLPFVLSSHRVFVCVRMFASALSWSAWDPLRSWRKYQTQRYVYCLRVCVRVCVHASWTCVFACPCEGAVSSVCMYVCVRVRVSHKELEKVPDTEVQMLSVVSCLLSAFCFLLSAVCFLLSTVCCLCSAFCCLLFLVYGLLSVFCFLLSAFSCLRSAVCVLLSAVCFLLSTVCCLCSAFCCLLSLVYGLLSAIHTVPPFLKPHTVPLFRPLQSCVPGRRREARRL